MVGGEKMAFEDKKGIVVASPFKLQAEALLDVRQQVDTIAERDRLVTLKAATAGLRVFVKENSTSYVYTGSKWDPLTTGAPYKHPTGDGNHHVPATGTTNAGKYLKAGATAGSEAWSKIAASDITGLPTKLPNPKAIKFTGAATGSYDGSSELTVNIPTSGTTDSALIIQMNGGTTEGNNKFTFNGSAAKNINITPANIGAAASTHSHNYAGSGSAGGAANSAVKLATARQLNGVDFDGTKNIDIPIKYTQLQASNFGNNADRLDTVVNPGYYHINGSMESYDFPVTSDNTALQVIPIGNGTNKLQLFYNSGVFSYRDTVNDIWKHLYSTDAPPNADAVGASPEGHRHIFEDITDLIHAHVHSSDAIFDSNSRHEITVSYSEAVATSFSYIPVFTGYDHIGNIGKSSFLTQVGAAPKSHSHNYAGSSSAGGPANSAKKVDFPVGTVLWTTSSSASFFSSTCGGTWEVMGNIDAIVNTSTTITLYMHKKTAL